MTKEILVPDGKEPSQRLVEMARSFLSSAHATKTLWDDLKNQASAEGISDKLLSDMLRHIMKEMGFDRHAIYYRMKVLDEVRNISQNDNKKVLDESSNTKTAEEIPPQPKSESNKDEEEKEAMEAEIAYLRGLPMLQQRDPGEFYIDVYGGLLNQQSRMLLLRLLSGSFRIFLNRKNEITKIEAVSVE